MSCQYRDRVLRGDLRLFSVLPALGPAFFVAAADYEEQPGHGLVFWDHDRTLLLFMAAGTCLGIEPVAQPAAALGEGGNHVDN
jgi:hypothetical protein